MRSTFFITGKNLNLSYQHYLKNVLHRPLLRDNLLPNVAKQSPSRPNIKIYFGGFKFSLKFEGNCEDFVADLQGLKSRSALRNCETKLRNTFDDESECSLSMPLNVHFCLPGTSCRCYNKSNGSFVFLCVRSGYPTDPLWNLYLNAKFHRHTMHVTKFCIYFSKGNFTATPAWRKTLLLLYIHVQSKILYSISRRTRRRAEVLLGNCTMVPNRLWTSGTCVRIWTLCKKQFQHSLLCLFLCSLK